jgi:hypothetical protein
MIVLNFCYPPCNIDIHKDYLTAGRVTLNMRFKVTINLNTTPGVKNWGREGASSVNLLTAIRSWRLDARKNVGISEHFGISDKRYRTVLNFLRSTAR